MNFKEFDKALFTPIGDESLSEAIEQKDINKIRKRIIIALGLGFALGCSISVMVFALSTHGVI